MPCAIHSNDRGWFVDASSMRLDSRIPWSWIILKALVRGPM
jgi:hypothetical protein